MGIYSTCLGGRLVSPLFTQWKECGKEEFLAMRELVM